MANPFLPLNTYIADGEPHVFGNRVYLFGSHDKAGGDTYYAFAAASSQFDTGLPLDEVLMDYITTELKGVVGEQYAQPQGRMTITLPAEEPTTPTKPESPKTADTGVVVYGLVAVMAAGAVVVMTSKKRKAI